MHASGSVSFTYTPETRLNITLAAVPNLDMLTYCSLRCRAALTVNTDGECCLDIPFLSQSTEGSRREYRAEL